MRKTKVLKFCLVCGKQFYVNLCRLKIGKGKFCSKNCYGISKRGIPAWNKGLKLGASKFRGVKRPELSGKNHWNWKGGLSKTTRFDDTEWNNTRKLIYRRDNWTCQRCNKHCHSDIQCHHLIPYRLCKGNENKILYWDVTINSPANLITLCKSCHLIVEKEVIKQEKMGFPNGVPIVPLRRIYA